MEVATVTTADGSLLRAAQQNVADCDQALLCVAFVSNAGLGFIEKELKATDEALLLATTAFRTTELNALNRAPRLGVAVKTLNPAGGTYHPKVFLGRREDQVSRWWDRAT